MTTLTDISAAVARTGLGVVGAFHPGDGDNVPEGIATLVLLGPDGAGMWQVFASAAEMSDKAPNPLERWSRRVIDRLAVNLGATALYPFGGPPWLPFQRWAARGEGASVSPVGMQATPKRGLWASYRGALGFRETIDLPPRDGTGPCLGCPAPCLSACPVAAFASGSYDIPTCTAHVTSPDGIACRSAGCRVRAACPAAGDFALPKAQRAFHMAAFLRAHARPQTEGRQEPNPSPKIGN